MKNNSIQVIALDFLENKNNKTFTALMNRLRPGIFQFAYNYLKDKDLANDVVSQTFLAVWEKIDQYNPKFNFSTWVYAIAKNESLGIIKTKNKNVSLETYTLNHSHLLQLYNPVFNMNTEVIGPSGEDLTKKLFDASISIINELDEPYRSVMIEREINKKQLNEIANDLKMNLSTVKTRLRRARKDVAKKLSKKYSEMVESYLTDEK